MLSSNHYQVKTFRFEIEDNLIFNHECAPSSLTQDSFFLKIVVFTNQIWQIGLAQLYILQNTTNLQPSGQSYDWNASNSHIIITKRSTQPT